MGSTHSVTRQAEVLCLFEGRERTPKEPRAPPLAAEPQVEYSIAAASKLISPFSIRASSSSASGSSLIRMCEAVATLAPLPQSAKPIVGVPPRATEGGGASPPLLRLCFSRRARCVPNSLSTTPMAPISVVGLKQ